MRKHFVKLTVAAACVSTLLVSGGEVLAATNLIMDNVTANEYVATEKLRPTESISDTKSLDVKIEPVTYKKTFYGTKGQKITVNIVYPSVTISKASVVSSKGNVEANDVKYKKLIQATKRANEVIYKKYIAPYEKYNKTSIVDDKFPTENAKINIKATYVRDDSCVDCKASVVGNLLSIRMNYSITDSAQNSQTEQVECLNINLTNGNKISFNSMLKKGDKVREIIAENYRNANSALLYMDGEVLYPKNFADDVASNFVDKITMGNCFFTYHGLMVVIDENIHGVHELGTVIIEVSYDDIKGYIRDAKKALILPSDMIMLEFPERSAGTGYSWEGDETAEGMFEVVYSGYKSSIKQGPFIMAGGPEIHYVILKSNGKAGEAILHSDYLRVWEGPESIIDSAEIGLVVDEYGSIKVK